MRTFRWGSVLHGRIATTFAAMLLIGSMGILAPAQAQPSQTLSLTKVAAQSNFTAAGQTLTYTYTVTNDNDFEEVVNITITDSKLTPCLSDHSLPTAR